MHIASFRKWEICNVEVHRLHTFGLGKIGYFFAIPAIKLLWRRIKPDIVHAHYVTSYGFLAAMAGVKPLIVTAWGSDVLLIPKRSFMMKWLASFALHKANAVTMVAEHMTESISSLGCPNEKCQAIPMGVNMRDFPFITRSMDVSGTIRLISTRSFEPIYNIETVIDAVRMAVADGVNLHLDLVGTGSLSAALRQKVALAGLNDFVTFHGRVRFDKLRELLGESDIFISSSLSDGNNISLNEAMAMGCFPIASDIPANSQWICHGKNGLLFDAHKAENLTLMIKSALHRSDFESIAIANRRIVEEKANWENCIRKMESLYYSLL